MVKRAFDVDYDTFFNVCEGCGEKFYYRDRRSGSFRTFVGRTFCTAACRHNQFWPRVDVKGADDCWPWKGSTSRGYGNASRNGKNARAHRVAYELSKGPIPPGLVVRHRCDNPPCCNPAHLELGTQRQNVEDSIERGRTRALDWSDPRVLQGTQLHAAEVLGFSPSAIRRARKHLAGEG